MDSKNDSLYEEFKLTLQCVNNDFDVFNIINEYNMFNKDPIF